jgi:hypothetical protein
MFFIDYKKMKLLYIVLVALAFFLSALAGMADIQHKPGVPISIGKRRYVLTKEHLWHDSLFLLILAVVLKVAF